MLSRMNFAKYRLSRRGFMNCRDLLDRWLPEQKRLRRV
jgi:hypothetical protein